MATLDADVQLLIRRLSAPPEPAPRPVLVMLVGLPGTGKTTFAARLAERFPLAVVESDAMRKTLFPRPTYSPAESRRVFAAIHEVLGRLLAERVPALLDATNLVEANRRELYQIAEGAGARLFIVRLTAPDEVVRRRLAERLATRAVAENSDAGWAVYEKLRKRQSPLTRPHVELDTSRDIRPALERAARALRRLTGTIQRSPPGPG
ncbi:MAG: ATP-binding protein [SAR202 cluster bacterium]|nr:ATP-binding protein [SAR202 cluster bacterium]